MRPRYVGKEKESRGKIVRVEPEGTVLIQMPLPLAGLMVDVQEEVEKLVTECGLLLMKACVDSEVEALAGPRYVHEPDREASRAGTASGWAYFAGRKVKLPRQRVRGPGGEMTLESVQAFQKDGRMQRGVAAKVLAGVKLRRYEECLEDVCEGYGIRKSSVSRHWVRASAQRLRALMERSLAGLNLAVILIDGLVFRNVCAVVALGVDTGGRKHVLGLYSGATENAGTCQGLLDDLIRRGLDPKETYLFVLDGSKALHGAIRKTFGKEAWVQRCQVHKKRNVKDHLPKKYHAMLSARLSMAWGMKEYAEAKAALDKTVAWLEGVSASAAASLREGMEETLTLHRLEIPSELRQSLSSTNLIESCFSATRDRSRNVKRWRGEDQILRWTGSMLVEAEKGFRRVKGYEAMAVLVSKLRCVGLDAVSGVA